MLSGFWSKPVFWVGFHLIGVVFTVVIYRLSAVKKKVLRMPKGVQRIFTMTFYLLPPLILPLLPQLRVITITQGQPRLSWPAPVVIGVGLALFMANVAMKVMAQRELGVAPVLRQKGNLVTTGIYGRVRHPMYLSNILLAVGWALLFRGIHALLCVPIWALCYMVLTFFEAKVPEEEYGEECREYRRKVPWRIIPGLF